MFELTICDEVYSFNFGMGFLRDVDREIQVPVAGVPGATQNVGLTMMIAKIMDGDLESLIDALIIANKGETPRLTTKIMDKHLEDSDTDIDKLVSDVLGFFEKANVTKKVLARVRMTMEDMQPETM